MDGNIEHVPPSEIGKLALGIARGMFGIEQQDLVTETARRLGFARTGGRIAEAVDSVIQQLLIQGELFESFGMLHSTK